MGAILTAAIRRRRRVRLEVGDCIRTRVPSPDVPEERGPLRDVELLDRACDA